MQEDFSEQILRCLTSMVQKRSLVLEKEILDTGNGRRLKIGQVLTVLSRGKKYVNEWKWYAADLRDIVGMYKKDWIGCSNSIFETRLSFLALLNWRRLYKAFAEM